jgi:hypothetical protein
MLQRRRGRAGLRRKWCCGAALKTHRLGQSSDGDPGQLRLRSCPWISRRSSRFAKRESRLHAVGKSSTSPNMMARLGAVMSFRITVRSPGGEFWRTSTPCTSEVGAEKRFNDNAKNG